MNDLQIFNYHDTPLRTVEKDGELWWVLKDVCAALSIIDHVTTAKRLEPDEVGQTHVIDSKGRNQLTYIVNEPGLYSVILRSDKPEAKDFKRWVTHEVLPAIRQKGSYSVPAMSPAQLIAAQAQLLVDMERRMDEMQGQTLALEEKVDKAMKAFSRPAEDHWRSDMDKAVKDLNAAMGWSLPKLRGKLFSELEESVNCNLNMRLTALRKRMKKTGMRYRDTKELGKLDAIAADKHLRAIFEGIVRGYQAQAVPIAERQTVPRVIEN